ncbi:MAG: glycosyltransferase family 4 protein [Bacteroidales bacterium]|nr:glycosyltransferase family 4 protein [Bacteroidales bacterium]
MGQYVFYTNDDFIHNRITGGTKRFKELICGLLERGDTIHLFIPSHAEFMSHSNLIRHSIVRKESRIFPNGLLNFIVNYPRLRSIRNLHKDRIVFISVPYAIQGILAGLQHITLILREDFIGYRRFRLESSRLPRFLVSLSLAIWRKVEGYTLKHVDRIIVQCEYDKRELLNRHPVLKEKIASRIRILKNNVNPYWIRNMEVKKQRWNGQKKGTCSIAYVGHIDNRRKGMHLLLEATKQLIDANYPVELHIMGDGKLKPMYQRQYEDYSGIVFYGKVKQPMEKLQHLDLLVVPSLLDSFPNTIMEALYLEIPVLGSRRGGIPEMLEYDELLVEPEVSAIFRRIAGIIDRNEWQSLEKLSRKRRDELTFDWIEEMKKMI